MATAKKIDKFATFIISHQRANSIKTLDALKEANYTGDYYIIIDDEDTQKDLYLQKFKDKVCIFSKDEMLKDTDTIDNFNKKTSAVFARNYCFKLAKQLNLKYFLELDDDIESFCIRYEANGSLKRKEIKDFNEIIIDYLKIFKNEKVKCISFAHNGGYIGGVNGKFKKGFGRTCCMAMIFRTCDLKFMGIQGEDFNICYEYGKKGDVFLELYLVSCDTPKRGSNEGGNKTDYESGTLYVSCFYSLILAPSCCKIIKTSDSYILKRNWNNFVPMIINERYRK